MSKDNPTAGVRYPGILLGPDTLPASHGTFPQFGGKATIAQNSNGVTVPCTHVESDSVVFVTPMGDTVASGTAMLQVASIVPGTSFDVRTADAANVTITGGLGFAWRVYHTQ